MRHGYPAHSAHPHHGMHAPRHWSHLERENFLRSNGLTADSEREYFYDNRGQRVIIDGDGKIWQPYWFVYPTPLFNLAAGATGQQTITIEADSRFELLEMTRSGTLHGGSAPFNNDNVVEVALQIVDTGSGTQLIFAGNGTVTGVPLDDICGSGQRPYRMPESYMFMEKSTIQLNFTNYSGANQYDNIGVALIGRKFWRSRG